MCVPYNQEKNRNRIRGIIMVHFMPTTEKTMAEELAGLVREIMCGNYTDIMNCLLQVFN